jgi:hypothetical protein
MLPLFSLSHRSAFNELANTLFVATVILVKITHGSEVSITLERDDHGNLKGTTLYTLDLRNDGFRYLIAVASRERVKSVNGEELPAVHTQDWP